MLDSFLNPNFSARSRQRRSRPTSPFGTRANIIGIGHECLYDFKHDRFGGALNARLRTVPHKIESTNTDSVFGRFDNRVLYADYQRRYELMQNNTSSSTSSYLRSVNDYTLSTHQLFNDTFGSSPQNIFILNLSDIPHTNTDALYTEVIAFGATLKNGLKVQRSIGSKFINDDPADNDDYTAYRQIAATMSDDVGNDIALEMISSTEDTTVVLLFNALDTSVIDEFGDAILEISKKYKIDTKERKDRTFYTISSTPRGYELEDLSIKNDHKPELIIDNYNDDFIAVNEVIKSSIADNKKGLILLHGMPGSGKTSYIKHLITSADKRKIVYIPTHLSTAIASPAFISFVKSELSNAVLVIEDAEQVLISRESDVGSRDAVSNILNMTDGILADALNLLIICTFNTDMKYLDKALLRKGRLLLQYEFTELRKEKADALCMKLYNKHSDSAMLLSEIYNLEYDLIKPKEQEPVKFGFHP